jgi:hypothetical protein
MQQVDDQDASTACVPISLCCWSALRGVRSVLPGVRWRRRTLLWGSGVANEALRRADCFECLLCGVCCSLHALA